MTKEELLNYLKNNEIDVQNANAAFIVADLVYAAYVESKPVHGLDYTPVSCYFYGNSTNFYQLLDKKNVKNLAHKIYDDYIKNPQTLVDKISAHEKLTKKMDDLCQNFSNIQKMDNAELADFNAKFTKIARHWWHLGTIGEDKGAVITDKVVPIFQKKYKLSLQDAQHLVGTLSHPIEQSVLNIERKNFLNVCLYLLENNSTRLLVESGNYEEALKENELSQLVDAYLKSGFWIKTDFYKAIIITPKSLLKEVIDYLKVNTLERVRQESNQIDFSNENLKKEQNLIRNKYSFDASDESNIYFSQMTALWIDRRKEGMMKQIYYFLLLVQEIAARFSLSYNEATYYLVDELGDLLLTGNKKDTSSFKTGSFVLYETGKSAQFFYGDDGEELLAIAKHVKIGKQLKGMVASKGNNAVVDGRVKIILDPQSENFTEGYILVTSMTRVEFVPLMRKAKAIITNEGGIACHAAIVSRELGIPCIIGTKAATDFLKDGDFVQMDLQKGFINKTN